MDLGLKGKRVLVQGASAGLGFAIAEMMVKEGARVAICSRSEANLAAAAKKMKAEFSHICDLTKPGAGRMIVEETIKALGGIDVLVCNTGGPPKGVFADVSPSQWNEGFQSLWLSVVESVQAALPTMQKQKWGRILLVTSIAAREPLPAMSVSNGLRAGLLGLSKSLATEVAQHGITVNALLPGYTRTERLAELGIAEEKMTAGIPAKRLGEPQELAALTAFLASNHAGYVTGQMIACDGGFLKGF